MSPEKREALNVELDRMIALGVVSASESPWNNPVLLVQKQNGDWRFCLDYRKLNAVSKGDAYAMPYIPQILDSLRQFLTGGKIPNIHRSRIFLLAGSS